MPFTDSRSAICLNSPLSAEPHQESSEIKPTRRLGLAITRELTAKALESSRRRELKRLADLRSDPAMSKQLDSKSNGILFLSDLQGELNKRHEKALRAKALQQKTDAHPNSTNDSEMGDNIVCSKIA